MIFKWKRLLLYSVFGNFCKKFPSGDMRCGNLEVKPVNFPCNEILASELLFPSKTCFTLGRLLMKIQLAGSLIPNTFQLISFTWLKHQGIYSSDMQSVLLTAPWFLIDPCFVLKFWIFYSYKNVKFELLKPQIIHPVTRLVYETVFLAHNPILWDSFLLYILELEAPPPIKKDSLWWHLYV